PARIGRAPAEAAHLSRNLADPAAFGIPLESDDRIHRSSEPYRGARESLIDRLMETVQIVIDRTARDAKLARKSQKKTKVGGQSRWRGMQRSHPVRPYRTREESGKDRLLRRPAATRIATPDNRCSTCRASPSSTR